MCNSTPENWNDEWGSFVKGGTILV